MLPGDLIRPKHRKPRNTIPASRDKKRLPVYTVCRVNDDGTLEVQCLDTGQYKHISRPEHYKVINNGS